MKTDDVEKDHVGEAAAANDGRGGTLRAVGPFGSCLQVVEELTEVQRVGIIFLAPD